MNHVYGGIIHCHKLSVNT